MTEYYRPDAHPAIVELTSLLDIPTPEVPLKHAKDEVIHSLGFYAMPYSVSRRSYFYSSSFMNIYPYVKAELACDFRVTLRLVDDFGEKGGKYPIVHLTSPADIYKIATTNKEPAYVITEAGNIRNLNEFRIIHAFSRHNSMSSPMGNFDKPFIFLDQTSFEGVKLGGGFRMQLDNLREEDDTLQYDFSVVTVFQDETPRKTSLNAPNILYTQTPFTAQYHKGALISQQHTQDITEIIKQKDAINFSYFLLGNLLQQDGKPLANLFNGLLVVDPHLQRHSIEGVFTTIVNEKGQLQLFCEIIDFDGIDTPDPKQNTSLSQAQQQFLSYSQNYSEGHIKLLLADWIEEKRRK